MTDQPLWQPTPQQIRDANLSAFMELVGARHGVEFADYEELWRWSVERREHFWVAVWDFCRVVAGRRWDEVLVGDKRMLGSQWFVGARLNFAENLLRFHNDRPALVFWNEEGKQRELTFRELHEQVARLAGWLRSIGIRAGERIAALMPNMPETIVAMLAAASLGATFSSCSPDFGVQGVADRFGQIEPRVLFTTDGYYYGGKTIDLGSRVAEIQQRIPSIERTVVVSYLNQPRSAPADGSVRWEDASVDKEEIQFEQLPFDHPLYILYSSGTTGVPKCIVHGAGGTLLQHFKEHVLQTDLRQDDHLFYFTTCGWMMWNWLVSGLATGCRLVLFDGSPFYPSAGTLFDMADEERVTVFGTSAKYISAIEKEGLRPAETHDLSALRSILSTGSPLAAESFDYVYQSVKPDVCLSSISGGTDIVSCFALGNPLSPVRRGELQGRGLGMKVDVFDDDGNSLVGKKGELVCTAAFPSMPVGFWNDPDGAKYQAAYFDRFDNVWCHGDYCELTEHGGMVIYGRSDAVLNPGGVRIGTAEIYRLVEQVPEVIESLVVGQQWEDDVRVVLFVQLREGAGLDEPLVSEIKQRIRAGASPRHVPSVVVSVPGIPRTKSGKIVELAVRDVIHGREIENRHALANPEALEFFRDLPELGT